MCNWCIRSNVRMSLCSVWDWLIQSSCSCLSQALQTMPAEEFYSCFAWNFLISILYLSFWRAWVRISADKFTLDPAWRLRPPWLSACPIAKFEKREPYGEVTMPILCFPRVENYYELLCTRPELCQRKARLQMAPWKFWPPAVYNVWDYWFVQKIIFALFTCR